MIRRNTREIHYVSVRGALRAAPLAAVLVLLIATAPARAEELAMPDPMPHVFTPGVRAPTAEEAKYLEGKINIITKVEPNKTALARAAAAGAASGGLPAKVINYEYLPVVGDQGSLGSCASFATCYYYKTYQESKEHGWGRPDPAVNPERVFSPAYCYNLTNNGGDLGGFPSVLTRFMVDHGAATWQDMPYNDNDYTTWPDEADWRGALQYRAESAEVLVVRDDDGVANLKQRLANGDIGVMALPLYRNFFWYGSATTTSGINNKVLFETSGAFEGNHAMAVIGYDDNKAFNDGSGDTSGAFLIVNSWGDKWGAYVPEAGTKGFIWMSYYYFKNRTNGLAWFMTDKTNYTPEVIATVGIDHSMRQDLEVYFNNGADKETPDWEYQAIYGLGGAIPVKQNLIFDLTPYASKGDADRITLRVFDKASNFTTGKITSYKIEKAATGETYEAGAAPVDTLDGQSVSVPIALPAQNMILHTGWNLVGASSRGATLSPDAVFATAPRAIYSFGTGFANLTLDPSVPLEPGRGYWIYSDKETGAAVVGGSNITDPAITLSLNSGWNIISNPYSKPLPWRAGSADLTCGALPTAYLYDNLYGYAPVPPSGAGTLLPWRAYWLYAPASCSITFTKPAE